ncbi:hypothetical protein PSTG_18412 [Puccinia striiformis f. sp. tritici PST-78]|uniref:Uncharacterized protein n=1 Tax=Puccinia striiformis f. sp. tritici PST-78 TaxID=1165861 RepID=A0A0L0UMF6_9BASI|nr:hypothetical protein PSTG_18412 [Puccinia striiformis f. sp. tritici PST-78]
MKLLKECKGNIIVVGKSGAGKNTLVNRLDRYAAEVVILDKVNISDARLFKASKLYDFIRLAGERGQRIIVLTQSEINPAVAICFDGMISITSMDEEYAEFPVKKKKALH